MFARSTGVISGNRDTVVEFRDCAIIIRRGGGGLKPEGGGLKLK